MTEKTHSLKGIYRDILKYSDGTIVHDSGWSSNTIVDSCRQLLASFMHNDAPSGIQLMAVGAGDPAWDATAIPPSDPATTTDLVDRFATPIDVADLEIEFLDASDQVVPTPTSRLQITATLDPGFPTPPAGLTAYPLREFGLFGGNNLMINSIRHPVIQKDNEATLIRVVRLYF